MPTVKKIFPVTIWKSVHEEKKFHEFYKKTIVYCGQAFETHCTNMQRVLNSNLFSAVTTADSAAEQIKLVLHVQPKKIRGKNHLPSKRKYLVYICLLSFFIFPKSVLVTKLKAQGKKFAQMTFELMIWLGKYCAK